MPINTVVGCRVFLLAEGIKCLLQDVPHIRVVGMACNHDELFDMVKSGTDILIADQYHFQALLRNGAANGPMRILLINENVDLSFSYGNLQDMVTKGLAGILPHNADSCQLKKAIAKVHSGELWMDHKTIKNSLFQHESSSSNIVLTRREKQVLHCLCAGDSNKKIAQTLFISEQTVKSHCNRLFKKFGVPNRVKLALHVSRYSRFSGAMDSIQ